MKEGILRFFETLKIRIPGIRRSSTSLAVKIFFVSLILVNFPYTLSAAQNLADISFESKTLQLPPWQGVSHEVDRFSGVSISESKFSWVGQLKGERPGFVSLGKVGDEISLTVSFSDGEVLTFRGKADDFFWELQKTTAKPCGGCRVDNELPADPRMRQQPVLSWQNGDANLIDLLVVYPNAVTTAAGSTAAIQADILSSVADTNLCYRNSKLNIQLRLVHMEEVGYTPTGILDDDLSRLKGKADGFMDSVHATRDQYGADLVALLTTASDAGGLASTMSYPSMAFESSGFSVNVWDQIGAPSYTLAHEIGHNMGCLHNVEDSNDVTSSYVFGAFCYGKRWLAGGQGYRTVMSYDTSPNSTYPNTVPYFSNPTVSYQGTTTGESGSADNALVLRSTAPYVSNFRSSTVQGIVATMYDVQVTEGNYSTLGIRLATTPTSPISVNLSLSGDADIVLGTPASLTFDANNWNLLQTVQIHALADANSTGDTSTLLLSANGMPSASVSITEVDNGTALPGTHIISGVVVNSLGVGLEGVPLAFSNGGGVTHSDPTGAFSMELASGWSGTFAPSSNSYAFSPSQLTVSALSQSSLGHAFQGARSHILYVNTNASGAGDGSSWADAFTDLGDALRATVPYSEIWVAQGNYRPGLVRSSHFLIPPGKEVYGGFAGGETDINQRNPAANPTILSGDIGISDDFSDNTFHVVIPSHESILDGFTVIGGNASENFSNDDRGKGAGLWAESSTFTVRNCIFSSNMAYQGGAGIYLKEVNASFLSCAFSLNVAGSSGSGGAAYLEDSNVSFHSCSFSSNDAGFQAGAIRWENSTGAMIDSNFTSNRNTASNGGGALFLNNSSPDILRCHFAENSTLANNYGGAIKMDGFNGSIIDSVFIRNQSLVNAGGAIYLDVNSVPIFSGNEYHYNSAASFGGAIFVEDNNLSLDGDIFLGNSAEVGGAIGTQGGVDVNIRNVRAYGNEANATGTGSGGFIYLGTGTTGSIFVNSVFSGNKANGRSGVLRANGTSRFVNCTLVGNHAGDLGGISILFSANNDLVEFDNSIIWGNTSANGGNDISVNTGTATATSSIFDPSQSSGTISGSNNSSADPSFVDADGLDDLPGTLDDDLRLLAGSPAIDNGSTSVADFLSTDLAGNARVGPPEIGAYEYSTNFLPLISTANTLNIIEGSSAVGTIQATDSDGDTLTFSITGGDDQALFLINAGTGALSFASPPDFETPSDLNGDNVYELQIEVNDGTGSSTLSLQVTLLNSNEPPVSISSLGGLTIPENETVGTTVGHFTASDPDAGASLTYALVNGAGDANNTLFTLESNGTLKSASVLDYEAGSVLSIRARVTDENGGLLEGNFTILVTDVYEAPANLHTADLNASVNIEMLWVEPGTFTMGSPTSEAGRETSENETQVTLTEGFYLGKYEVTQAQYEAVMTNNTAGLSPTPSNFLGNPNRPVEQVSWNDVQVFLQRLNDQQAGNIPPGWAYVLPTEAQWEYACRAGTTTVYSWGDTISAGDANWNHGNDANATEGVGQYAPNPWGFFDMHGNVWEWTADWYDDYEVGPLTDPTGATSGSTRVLRGGSWLNDGTFLRSAHRSYSTPSIRGDILGFRVGFQIQPDTASPELELFGRADVPHKRDEPWAEPGFGASDVRDGNLTDSVIISGIVDVNNTGVYTLTYTVSDAAGNEANTTRTVRVVDHFAELNSTIDLEMIWVEPGTFTMGSPLTEAGRESSENETQVTLTQGFYLGKYEVTQAQYEAVMTGVAGDLNATPSNFLGNPNRPVEQVSWDDVQVFLQRLNFQQAGDIPAGWAYVLPTEAQWEYACRAGTTTVYSWGDTISAGDANWDHGNDANATEGVGQYAPNPWGFFDMHGNVFEWCADWYGAYNIGPLTDPLGAASGLYRGVRGGSWNYGGTTLRSARRSGNAPSARHHHLGFRVGFQKITEPPVDLNSTSPLTILENQPIGTFVGEFNATDPDSNGSLTYSLVSGSGDDNNSLFVLDHNGTLRTTVPLDYETGDHLSILVQVADDQNATQVRNFTVQVLNENEPPVISHTQINITIDEDSNLSQINITASDPDVGEILTWNVIQPHEANGSAYFTGNVNSPSNFIYVPDPNFNGQDSLKLTVTDVTGLTSEVEINLTITPVEDFPEIALSGTSPYQIFTPENLKSIGILSAFDPDGQPLNFSITGGTDATKLTIDQQSGEISFAAVPDFEEPADSDQNNVYQIMVSISDNNGNTITEEIQVNVLDAVDLSTYVFSNAGATGINGPTQNQVNLAYSGTDLDGDVVVTSSGIQEWVVPFSGKFLIEATGAEGGGAGNTRGGKGAKISGEFNLVEGEMLKILVGQMGASSSSASGAGGGTFVIRSPYNTNQAILVIAGGGGGVENGSTVHHGLNTQNGGSNGEIAGGTAGNGGTNDHGQGGAGFFTGPSGHSDHGGTFPKSFIQGGTGGIDTINGGFGGGGAGDQVSTGGGGGYSGGSSGGNHTYKGGGGGGSFNSGTNPVNLAGINSGHGKVIISAANTPPTDLSISNRTLPENLPAGSEVGQFSAVDPDDPGGVGSYFYTLVAGFGDTHNSLFTLDLNGTLKTSFTADYEAAINDNTMSMLSHSAIAPSLQSANYPASLYLTSHNQYPAWSIRMKVVDGFGAFFEKSIEIALLDRDDIRPVISLSGSASIVHEAASVYQDGGANWTDNVDGGGVLVANGTVNVMVPGSYTLTYDITDAAGNMANQVIRTVTVVDSIKPVITLGGNANIIHEAATAYSDDGASWADAVDGNGTLIANGAMNVMVPGTYTLTYDITDTAGNVADQVVRTITVVDSTKPMITLLGEGNITQEGAIAYSDQGAIWDDTVDGNGSIVASGIVDVMVPGNYTLTYDITDSAGNVADQVIRSITVVDTTKPVITLLGDAAIIHEGATGYADKGAIWTDTVDGNGTILANGFVDVMVPGNYTLTYNIMDTAGNMADQVTRSVTVVDTTKPVISLLGNATVIHEGATAYIDEGATWMDTVDGNGSIVASGIVDVMVPGNYTLTYDITDTAGNVADQVTRTVTVVDTTKPVISLLGNATITHEGATGYSDYGATWTDTVDGNGSIVANGFVDVMVPGSYILTYETGDRAGNNADQIIRTVNLVDTTKPVITLNGDANVSHVVASVYSDEGAVWKDTIDGNGSIAAVGNVDVMVPGVYTLTYDVSDVAGNAATQIERFIHVVNRDPDSLFIDQNVVEENYPAGFYIGTLGTTDPDDPQGIHSYTYELIAVDNGASDGFDITLDGRVSATRTFDFEKQEKYILSLRVRDAFGGKYEHDIEIRIIDAFIPLVETVGVSLDSNYTLQMEGLLIDEGGTSGVLDVGFFISENPIISINQIGLFAVSANWDANFSFVHAEPLNIGSQKIYIRAFAETEEGVNLGLEEIVRVPEVSNPSLWSDALPLETAQGWWSSDWFGTFYNGLESGWILHHDLGWLYPSPSVIGGVWLWKDSFGWLWTDQQKFPFLFSDNSQSWLYYYGVLNQRRLLFDYGTGQWIVLDESDVLEREGAR